MSPFQQARNFFENPSLATFIAWKEPLGPIDECLEFLSSREDFVLNSLDGISLTTKRLMLTYFRYIHNKERHLVFRHLENSHLTWTEEELDFFPLINNRNVILSGYLIEDYKLCHRYAESLTRHFIDTGTFHPIIWQLPLKNIQMIESQRHDIFQGQSYKDFYGEYLSTYIGQPELLDHLLYFGHADKDFWDHYVKAIYENNNSEAYSDDFGQLYPEHYAKYIDFIPKKALEIFDFIDISTLSPHDTLTVMKSLYAKFKNKKEYIKLIDSLYASFYDVPFADLADATSVSVVLECVDSNIPIRSQIHPDNKTWILNHFEESSSVIQAYRVLQQSTTLTEVFEKEKDNNIEDLVPNVLIFHLMEIQEIPNVETVINMLYNCDLKTYWEKLQAIMEDESLMEPIDLTLPRQKMMCNSEMNLV